MTAWSTWQDPDASRRNSPLKEEETQGNGGKAYMYRLFAGPTRILGVRDGRRNCKGFEGIPGTVERGTPGWVPNLVEGREVEISSFDAELREALRCFDLDFEDLPAKVREVIGARKAFTLVDGQDPVGVYKGRIDSDELVGKVVRHEQSTLCLEQIDFFVLHNGRMLNNGRALRLPEVTPYPDLETPLVWEIPDHLQLESGQEVSTTEGGTRDRGRLILHTSAENMYAAWRNLRPRWQIVYRTRHQMIGSKPVSEIASTTPGAQYVYGTVELPSLEPAYVEHGQRRPKQGPVTEALDRFIAQKIKELAHQISDRRQQKLDEHALEEVHRENQKLDRFKNRFLPNSGEGDGGPGNNGAGPDYRSGEGPSEWGNVPDELVYSVPEGGIQVGKGLIVALRPLLEVSVRDANGRPVRKEVEWFSTDHRTASVTDGLLHAREKGSCEIWVHIPGTSIVSERIPVRVWSIDHVLLSPRSLDIRLGRRQKVIAEVTDDEGQRSTHVLIEWRHDAEDQLTVGISRDGFVTGNRLGRTAVTAGADDVWARIPVEVNVIPNPEEPDRGSGFPRLLLTGRDLDPETAAVREGDPDQPPIWQEPSDFIHNVWWLNLQSPEAAFAFRQRGNDPILWRTYHAEKLIDMVVQVWMTEEFTLKGESQRPEFWAAHLAAIDRHRVRLVQQMWKQLEPYISDAEALRLMDQEIAL